VQARGGDADDRVARAHPLRAEHLRALDDAAGEARQVEVPGRVEPRHLGRLPAGQGAAHGRAGLGDRAHELRGLPGVEAADREVVEEGHRTRARAGEVVDAHRHQVLAQAADAPQLLRQQQLGADPVGAGDEHRLAHARGERQGGGEAGLPARDQRRDRLDVALRGVQVDPGVAVGQGGALHRAEP
jgi:hypothetical protein